MVFTGSGASQPSGIPTFSETDAIVDWGIDKFLIDAEWRREVWEMLFETYWDIRPNPTHAAIERFVLDPSNAHVTSNVDALGDGLEVCGNARIIRCTQCPFRPPIKNLRERWLGGDGDLACEICNGILRPDVVFIGEGFDNDIMTDYDKEIDRMEALVVIGASELIGMWYPAVRHAMENDIPIVSINLEKKPWKKISDVHLIGDAAELTPQLLG